MSVAVIDPDTSVASMIDARSTGTATVRCGFAAAKTAARARARRRASARAGASAARRGATEGCTAGAANAAAAARRLRCSPR